MTRACPFGRRRASGSRYRPALRRTRSGARAAGIPAAVTNSGRAEDPCRTGTAWVAVRNRTWPSRSPRCRTRRAGARPGRGCPAVQAGAAGHQQARPAQLARGPGAAAAARAGRAVRTCRTAAGDYRGVRPALCATPTSAASTAAARRAGPEVVHVDGCAHAAVRAGLVKAGRVKARQAKRGRTAAAKVRASGAANSAPAPLRSVSSCRAWRLR